MRWSRPALPVPAVRGPGRQVITQTRRRENVGAYDQMIRDMLANLTAPFSRPDGEPGHGSPHRARAAGSAVGSGRRSRSWSTRPGRRSSRSTPTTWRWATCTGGSPCPRPAPVHYSGAPLAVDFGEQDNINVVCLIEVAPDTPAQVTDLPITAGRRLRTVTGTVDQLLADPDAYGEDFLRVCGWPRPRTRGCASSAGGVAQRAGDPPRSAVLGQPAQRRAAPLDRRPHPRRALRRLLRGQPGRRPAA